MGEINIPRAEQEAIKAIDSTALRDLVHRCLDDGSTHALLPFRLHDCGPFICSKLHRFDKCLAEYRQAKAPKKVATTRTDALHAGSNLIDAVEQMKGRVESDAKKAELFYVDDYIPEPFKCTEQLSVTVRYRWRANRDGEWTHGSIEFRHRFHPRPDYLNLGSTRKRAAAQESRDRQEKLDSEWEHLKRQALWSVRDYFEDGGDGAKIPKVFDVKLDPHTRSLNNFSARFW